MNEKYVYKMNHKSRTNNNFTVGIWQRDKSYQKN